MENFFNKISPEPNSGCWLWTGAINSSGYAVARVGARQNVRVHREIYELERGPIPEGLCACHKCDNRLCVNPDHIFIGTRGDNNRDMYAKGRANRPRGMANNSRLTDEQVRFIKVSSAGTRELAREMGVSHTCISRIRRGLKWEHVNG